MLKKLLLILIPLIAFGAGALGGLQLKPSDDHHNASESESEHDSHAAEEAEAHSSGHGQDEHASDDRNDSGGHDGGHDDGTPETFTFPSQFFVPLVRAGDSNGMMIMTISLQTTHDEIEHLAKQEHRLRDILLRRLLIIANTGGFDGNFTTEGRLRGVRKALLEAVQDEFGARISKILIGDIARQDS